MPGILITSFAGTVPRLSSRLLGPAQAQTAKETELFSGELRPFNAPSSIWTPTKVGTKQTIYRYGQDVTNEAQYWFHWLTDVDVVRGPVNNDAAERTYWTGETEPRVTDSGIALSGGGTDYPINWYKLGVPKPAAAPIATLNGAGSGDPRYRAYVYTYVSAWGEQGPPSDPSNIVGWKTGQTVDLSGMSIGPGAGYNIATKRIYRALTGSTGTDYQFVAEIPLANTTYNDAIADSAIGEVCPSRLWAPPNSGLRGFTVVASSYLAAFLNNDVWFSEPFVPHAWPTRYRKSVPYGVVGLGAFDRNVAVLTKGEPYVGAGADPSSITLARLAAGKACVAKRGIVNLPGAVAYPCADGLGMISASGWQLLTEPLFTRKDWQAIVPSSISAWRWGRRYFGSYNTGSVTGGFIIDPWNLDLGVVWTDQYATAGYNDPQRDALYLQIGADIKKWDGGSATSCTWKSKLYSFPRHTCPAFAQVIATSYPVTFKLYADGVLKTTQSVSNADAFRLPAGYLALDFEVQIEGSATVRGVGLADSIEDLRGTVT